MSSSTMTTTPASGISSAVSSLGGGSGAGNSNLNTSAAQFREIHKNTWLKRLTAEGKRVTVGPKKSDRSWVVFCVHDDTEALLEGYAEPRQAASHSPEWIVKLQDTLHISHALIPNSHEFEFVVTLSNEVIRFHAMSWEIMQEWVETLRSKLREMKILSPRENLYTKLPEIRAPLLPTRDPTSPLPAPPPVPAALVPGVERVVPTSTMQDSSEATHVIDTQALTTSSAINRNNLNEGIATTTTVISETVPSNTETTLSSTSLCLSTTSHNTPILTSMSNTLTQNLLNMLSDPISTYNDHLNGAASTVDDINFSDADHDDDYDSGDADKCLATANIAILPNEKENFISSCLRRSIAHSNANSQREKIQQTANNLRVDISNDINSNSNTNRNSADNLMACERLIPRPQTSRSLSAGEADKFCKQTIKYTPILSNDESEKIRSTTPKSSTDNITELEITTGSEKSISSPSAATISANDTNTNITIIQVSTNIACTEDDACIQQQQPQPVLELGPPKLPVKNITAEVFKFPETHNRTKQAKTEPSITTTTTKTPNNQHEYKSNVQIIPSNIVNSNKIKVLNHVQSKNCPSEVNQYSAPVKNMNPQTIVATPSADTLSTSLENYNSCNKITTVHVAGDPTTTASPVNATDTVSIYGTCYTSIGSHQNITAAQLNSSSSCIKTLTSHSIDLTPKLPKKTILSANTSGITNITVNTATTDNALGTAAAAIKQIENFDNSSIKSNVGHVHYEKVFLSSSIPIVMPATTATVAASTSTIAVPKLTQQQWCQSPRRKLDASHSDTQTSNETATNTFMSLSPTPTVKNEEIQVGGKNHNSSSTSMATTTTSAQPTAALSSNSAKHCKKFTQSTVALNIAGGSPALERRRLNAHAITPSPPSLPCRNHRPPFLTRGLTEAAITTRHSRKDLYASKITPTKAKPLHHINNGSDSCNETGGGVVAASTTQTSANNNCETVNGISQPAAASSSSVLHAALNRTNSESIEQRRRSSSTSDTARTTTTRGINNNEFANNRLAAACSGMGNAALRIMQPPQPFRNVESANSASTTTNAVNNSPAAKRMTLREQQVMQLRREIMHPGGVRLQLRRKDCLGSIAWVDAFGAVWIAGWKQKEHPVLYNALHIGDQLLSIAGIAINSAADANKIIRSTNTLFVEVLVRRIPFGRGYAIRREREGQCLGLIRDGNTSTIVDVVPNSLAARHGLPPKAHSCDGTTLTFWVLTEINGRPLNLFFKENEIRDRLNSVGRDISILVQPSDLITKLKKQMKSLRSYKDYLVQ